MNLYNKYVLPKVTHFLCATNPVMKQREKVIPIAYGDVLEIGIGSGLNLGYYDPSKVEHLYGLEPSLGMWTKVKRQLERINFPIHHLQGYSHEIPLDNNSVDSIVITYTLCSINNLESSFAEMRRVLKPNGSLVFCEHGASPDPAILKWQNRLNPLWKILGGGCNLNRHIPNLIQSGGFSISSLETMYIPGYKPASYNYWGVAKPK